MAPGDSVDETHTPPDPITSLPTRRGADHRLNRHPGGSANAVPQGRPARHFFGGNKRRRDGAQQSTRLVEVDPVLDERPLVERRFTCGVEPRQFPLGDPIRETLRLRGPLERVRDPIGEAPQCAHFQV